MLSKVSDAVAAYTQAAKSLQRARGEPEGKDDNFASMVAGAVEQAGASVGRAETVSIQAIANQADINEVVAAVNEAEVALQAVIAVRDRVIQAYNDVIKMPI